MKLSILVTIFVLFALVGCEDPNQVKIKNTNRLNSDGEIIGKLKDGREIRRWEIERANTNSHWLYIIEDSDTVTVNHTVQQGKATTNKVEIFVK